MRDGLLLDPHAASHAVVREQVTTGISPLDTKAIQGHLGVGDGDDVVSILTEEGRRVISEIAAQYRSTKPALSGLERDLGIHPPEAAVDRDAMGDPEGVSSIRLVRKRVGFVDTLCNPDLVPGHCQAQSPTQVIQCAAPGGAISTACSVAINAQDGR